MFVIGAWKAGIPIKVWSLSVPKTDAKALTLSSGDSQAVRTPWARSQPTMNSLTKASGPAWRNTSTATLWLLSFSMSNPARARSRDRMSSCCVTPEGCVGLGTGDSVQPPSSRQESTALTRKLVTVKPSRQSKRSFLARILYASGSNGHPAGSAVSLYRMGRGDGAGPRPAPRRHRPRAHLGRRGRRPRLPLPRSGARPAGPWRFRPGGRRRLHGRRDGRRPRGVRRHPRARAPLDRRALDGRPRGDRLRRAAPVPAGPARSRRYRPRHLPGGAPARGAAPWPRARGPFPAPGGQPPSAGGPPPPPRRRGPPPGAA